MRAATYVRLSEETENTTSPARQRELCAAYAEARGWTVVGKPYEDIDVSATKSGLDRPALGRLREAVERGEVDVVIVWRLDRLARSVLDTLTLLKEWTDKGTAVASATESIDLTTPIGKAMVALIAVFAEIEADSIRARVTGSIDKLRRDGRFAGGTVGYGYRPAPASDGPGRVLVVDGEDAAVVREAARMITEGHSLGRVARLLNDRGVPAPRSEWRRLARSGRDTDGADRGVWRVQSLRRLLTSDHIAGRVVHRGNPMLDETGLAATVWDPIISGAELTQLRDLLTPGGEPREKRVRQARLLSGLARCACCGSKLYVQATAGRPIYSCPSRRNGVTCPSPRVSAEQLERYVSETALAVLGDRPMTQTVPVSDTQAEARGVSFREVERAITETTGAMTADDADVPALLERLAALKSTRAELREAAMAPVFYVVEETGEKWGDVYAAADEEARRVLLEAEISAVLVSPTKSRSRYLDRSRVEITWTPDA